MKTKLLIVFTFCTFNLFSQINLVPNNGFETWTNSTTPSNWTIKNNVTQNTSAYSEGSKSAQLSIASSTLSPEIIAQVPMTTGTTYTVKFKYKYLSTNYNGQHPISLNISQNGSATTLSSSAFATDNNWTEKETTFTPDQNLSYDLSISIFTFDDAAFDVLIDDVQVYIQGTEQYTLIPDLNFETKLIALGIDSGATDGKVLTNNINKLTVLNVSSSSITDLTGIQDFTALTALICEYNQLTNLDVSKNTALQTLWCTSNKLSILDVSKNLALYQFRCSGNSLTNLDVSKNLSLIDLMCSNNQLTNLDISKNLSLSTLWCGSNKLTSIDVSRNLKLDNFMCYANQLTSIDVSKNIALKKFLCHSNRLLNLNIKNGTNTLITNENINFTANPDLTCIVVDNVAYSNTNWADKKEFFAFFSPLDCSTVTKIPDAKFEDKLIALGIDTDGKNGVVLNSSIASITTLDVSGSSVADLTGIQGFSALKILNCSGNLLKKLDLSKNTAIATLNCSNNPNLICIQVADVAYSTANWATTKDATASFNLDCTIYTLIPDAKFEDKLIALRIDNDGKNGKVATESIAYVTSLDVSSSSISDLTGIQDFLGLKSLLCSNNELSALDVSKNTALTYLDCGNNKLTSLELSKNTVLSQLVCYNNLLSALDISNNTELTYLLASSNQLTAFDVSKNVKLNQIWCSLNKIKTLDFSKNPLLTQVQCEYNKLISLNIKNGNNSSISTSTGNNGGVRFNNNPDLKCIAVDDVAYANTNWGTKKDATAIFSPMDCSLITKIPDSKFEDKLIALGIDTDGKNGLVENSSISAVSSLDISNSSIADLTGIQGFTALTTLNCSGNLLEKIDLSTNPALTTLNCSGNLLEKIDLSTNPALTTLNCSGNLLVKIDFSTNPALTTLNCSGNLLKKVDLSKNTAIATLNCSNNPNLICIQVADVDYATANWATTKDATANFSLDCTIYTLIPDAKFEDKLIALGIDKDGKNGKVETESIASITFLDVSSSSITDLTGIQDFVSLTYLNCYTNQLAALDVSKNVALTYLDCTFNQLTTLDISKNVALTSLSCYKNQLANLNISKNTNLIHLDCSSNKLTSLDVTNNTVLSSLLCNNNQLTILDLSNNTELTYLLASSNQLTAFDVSKNVNLFQIWCQDNKIKTLDFSKNPLLTQVLCHNNRLVSLNIKNGKNTSISTDIGNNGGVRFSNNPNLKCILVDDVAYADTNWGTKKDVTASYNTDCTLYTSIPDSHFEDKLIAMGIDTDGKNGKVLTSSIFLLTTLDVSGSSIADLTGIEDFVNLTELNCNNNSLTALNVTKNIDLTSLKCSSNQLTTLDISKNIALIDLDCSTNKLTALDVPLNTKLIDLDCSSNKLTTFIALGNKALIHLDCSFNQLTTVDVSSNTALISLNCSSNQLKTLDVSKNILLQSVSSSQNLLEVLDVTNNIKLESILCSNNSLKTLDLSKNVIITTIDCSYNKLKSLNLRNGNNASGSGMVKNFTNNPDLNCIQVDDVTYAETNWKYYKDATASYSIDACYTLIPDAKFEDKLIALGIDKDGKNGKVLTENIISITSLNVSFSTISDLTGIQDFVSLTTLNCSGNQLTALDVSKNASLQTLTCYSNLLTALDVSKNKSLTSLKCYTNKLTSLDVSKNTALTYLDFNDNLLAAADVSKNVALTKIFCNNNKLLSLNLKNGNNTLITGINLSQNPNLFCVLVDNVTYSNTNWTAKDALTTFNNVECIPLSLTSNNFNVESKGETCLGSNNGEINITATTAYAYKAVINGQSYTFANNSLKLLNLIPGTFTISITIPGENFEQNFTVTIPKGATITGKSSVVSNKVSVEISEGTAPYTVFVDGVEQFETNDSNFSVATKKGGLLEVKTSKACEGVYAKDIAGLDGAVSAYPNPTSGSFEIEIPTVREKIAIALYTLDGHLISNKTYTIENGKAQLSLENQASGVYIAKIDQDLPVYLKIIKN